MTPQFQYAIVGRGLTGAAAARHLAEQVPGVVLIGPDEPVERATHQGVFGSHYDEGRITRTIDPDENWARLANRSIARYRDIEARSGVSFFSEKGCLISGLTTGRSQDYMASIRESASKLDVDIQRLDDADVGGAHRPDRPDLSGDLRVVGHREPGDPSLDQLLGDEVRLAEADLRGAVAVRTGR